MSTFAVWKLRPGADKRFRAGHPWVYSNELASSPKGLPPGAPVELQDASGKFLARGYGNPASLIAFRAVSRDPEVKDPFEASNLLRLLKDAARIRERSGLGDFSHRLCFGEADRLPGLVIDRYRLSQQGQVFVIQAHTAGVDRLVPRLMEVLEQATSLKWSQTAVVLRNDLGVRKLEGIQEEAPRVLKEVSGFALEDISIRVRSASSGKNSVDFSTNLLSGQKTGFFLDQGANIQLAALRFENLIPSGKPVRILDLCCYVGQWSTQLSAMFKARGHKVQVSAVDGSAKALEFARRNISAQGADCETLKGDVLKDLADLPGQAFDIVISDPPALIQGRKDLPVGKHAYLQLNTQVFRLVQPNGGVVTCSCSGLLEEEEFLRTVSKAAARNQASVRWVGRGAPAADHPMLMEFPEGRYLKAWVGIL